MLSAETFCYQVALKLFLPSAMVAGLVYLYWLIKILVCRKERNEKNFFQYSYLNIAMLPNVNLRTENCVEQHSRRTLCLLLVMAFEGTDSERVTKYVIIPNWSNPEQEMRELFVITWNNMYKPDCPGKLGYLV